MIVEVTLWLWACVISFLLWMSCCGVWRPLRARRRTRSDPRQDPESDELVAQRSSEGSRVLAQVRWKDKSRVVGDEEVAKDVGRFLRGSMPVRLRGGGDVELELVYSTCRDGCSLSTLYRKAEETGIDETLLLIRDSTDACFGCFVAHRWQMNPRYYGTGENFVFTLVPERRVYPWSRQDRYFQLSRRDYLAVGGGASSEGNARGFAIRLDGELLHGTSSPSGTFDSPALTSSSEFTVTVAELWSVQSARKTAMVKKEE